MKYETSSGSASQEAEIGWLGDNVPEYAGYDDKKDAAPTDQKEHPKTTREYLLSTEALTDLGENYLHQYERGSDTSAVDLSRKQYLDGLIYRNLKTEQAAAYMQMPEFQNYAKYTMWMAQERRFSTQKGDLFPETITNPILRDKQTRDLIIYSLHSGEDADNIRAMMDKEQEKCLKALGQVERRIDGGQKISQNQIDFLSDYVYQGGNYGDGRAKKLAEYCFNRIEDADGLKPSVPMLGALTNYFVKNYTIDESVREKSRVFISDNMRTTGDIHIGCSSPGFGCTLQKEAFLDMSLTSDESLNKSRTNRTNDLYHLMMVTFHEATHDHQRNAMNRGEETPSAMAYAVNMILRRDVDCIPVVNQETGEQKKVGYYVANHDSDEIEIDADEEAWRQCRAFLVNHCKTYGEEHNDRAIMDKFWRQRGRCLENEQEVRGRRAFTRKKNHNGELVNPIYYDVEQLSDKISESPNILKEYPQFQKYFNEDGSLKLSYMHDERVAATDTEGFDDRTDNIGVEFGAYLVNDYDKATKMAHYINENGANLSEKQATRLLHNMYNVLHQSALQSRILKKANFDNYDETRSHADQTPQEMNDAILDSYLRRLYHCTWIAERVRSVRPEMAETIDKEENGYYASYYRELSQRGSMSQSRAENVVRVYEKTKNPALMSVAAMIREQYGIPEATEE